jgi:hypothetical protein
MRQTLKTPLFPKNLFCFFACMLLAAAAFAEPVSGVVTNRTNNKPSAGDDVVLLQLAQGMQELARTKTDGKGRFTIEVPADGLHLLRVTHDKANYFKPIQPGTQSVDIDVFSAAPQVEGVTLDADVMSLQTEPGGSSLRVIEHFFVKNDSKPPRTLMSDHPFELYLPAGATVEGLAAKSPGGMAVQQSLIPETEPNKFTIIFPLRPGETEFQVTYKLPYSADKGFTFNPRPVVPTDTIALMMPKSMTFKAGTSAPYTAVTDEEVNAQTYVARNVQPSQPLSFTVTGAGQLPRDTTAGQTSAQGPATNGPGNTTSADPSTDTRPGGGLGVPVDKDAERDPWTKYRWWIISGIGLLFAVGAGFMMRGPSSSTAAAAGPLPAGPEGVLQVLRDELFAVETDRLSGKLPEAEYQQLKAAYDIVLKRAIDRKGTVEVVPE